MIIYSKGTFQKEDDDMDVSDIISGITAKKEAMGLTNQQLSDASGVPKSTVDRILRGDTPNPTLQSVLDMAVAVGYTFGEPLEAPESRCLDETSKYIIRMYDDRIARLRAHYNMLIAEKNRWITWLFFLSLALVLLIVGILIVDAIIPNVGWVRT